MAHGNSSGITTPPGFDKFEVPGVPEDEYTKYKRLLIERHIALALIGVMDELYARGNYDFTMATLYAAASHIACVTRHGIVHQRDVIWTGIGRTDDQIVTLTDLMRVTPENWEEVIRLILDRSGLFALVKGTPETFGASYRWRYECLQRYLDTIDNYEPGVLHHSPDTELFVREAERTFGAKPSRRQR